LRTEQKVAVITGASQGIGADALAYAQEMSNPPQTLSGIEDSPVGLPARMLDRDARSYALIARVFASQPEGLRDDILENVTLYWLTNTAVVARRGCGKADELTGDCLDDHHFRHTFVNHPRYLE